MAFSITHFGSVQLSSWNYAFNKKGSINILMQKYTLSISNIPNIELHPLLQSEKPQFVGHGLRYSIPQWCWPMLTPMLPTIVSSWLDVLFLIFDTFKPVHLAPKTIPHSSALKSFVLPIHPLNGTHKKIHVSIVSRLKNPSLTCLLPFIYTDWSGSHRLHQ